MDVGRRRRTAEPEWNNNEVCQEGNFAGRKEGVNAPDSLLAFLGSVFVSAYGASINDIRKIFRFFVPLLPLVCICN